MKKSITSRGFSLIEFKDQKGTKCSIQESSLYVPCVWVGVDDPSPVIMASQAGKHGVETNEKTGWVPFPIPDDVLLTTRMHLDKPGLRSFIDTLEEYYQQMPDFEEE